MDLSIWIPESDDMAAQAALSLARQAPACRILTGQGARRTHLAVFADLPRSLDLAVRLFGEAINLPAVRATINGRPVENLTKFWTALICYHESLGEQDPQAYCLRRTGRLGKIDGCPDRACLTHCQFICTRCLQIVRESGALPASAQLQTIARQAEVEWCPNLTLPQA